MVRPSMRLGIRAKLILLFVLIKVIPLVLLALLAWEGFNRVGASLAQRAGEMADGVRDTVGQLSKVMVDESTRALDLKSRDAIERLTTDTALAVANFLYDRDRDILLAASLDPSAESYRRFLANRTGQLIDAGQWRLADDGKGWVPREEPSASPADVAPSNPENSQDFHFRPAERLGKRFDAPLFHELSFIGLDGQERIKVSATDLLPRELRNVAQRENTYCRAENYFAALKKLKPGEIYVSNVIGPYVRSHYYGPVTPEAADKAGVSFQPEQEAYAGAENPMGRRFRGIVRWAAPVAQGGKVIGYVTLALDHAHIMRFTDHLMPTEARYTAISDASNGNYAFMWDYLDRSIAHPRHQSIVGFDPKTGQYETPWLDAETYRAWQESGKSLPEFLAGVPPFDRQSRDKKPAKELIQAGIRALDCRYLNFAPQCHGWNDLTRNGGSGSFVILWSGVWKLTTAATIPYFTGRYGTSPRGFGYVTIGANVDEFHKAATQTKLLLDGRVKAYGEHMRQVREDTQATIDGQMQSSALTLTLSTATMVAVVILIAIWLAGLLTRRVTYLNDGLRRIERGDLGYRLNKDSDDEMGVLALSINHMADGVQESFRRLEEARIKAEEASRMKSRFLASMSHELRTPLNGILGFAELLSLEAANEEQRGYAEGILGSGRHLLALLNEILDLAKIEAGSMELKLAPVPLRLLIEELAAGHRTHAEGKGLRFHWTVADSLPERIECDATRLRQVLNNLLNNAVKFTGQGSVDIDVRGGEAGHIVFAVSDTGPGIAPEFQTAIFEEFRQMENFLTREHAGTGLGLALVKKLTELMGGTVGVESTPGQGATFIVSLPLSAAE
jgi:hypothetical protein